MESEIKNCLSKMQQETADIVQNYSRREHFRKQKRMAVVLGTAFPEEILYAAGITPLWILGANPKFCTYSDDMLPGASDPVSCSVFGEVIQMTGQCPKETLFLIPLVNDSFKKFSFLLKRMGKSVCTLSLPVTREPHSGRLFLESMEECMEILERHFHKKLTARRLEKGRRLVLCPHFFNSNQLCMRFLYLQCVIIFQ